MPVTPKEAVTARQENEGQVLDDHMRAIDALLLAEFDGENTVTYKPGGKTSPYIATEICRRYRLKGWSVTGRPQDITGSTSYYYFTPRED